MIHVDIGQRNQRNKEHKGRHKNKEYIETKQETASLSFFVKERKN